MNYYIVPLKLILSINNFVVVQSLSCAWLFADTMDCSPPGSSVHFPGNNTGVGSHSLLHGTFPTQAWNPHLLHWQADSSPLSDQGSPQINNTSVYKQGKKRALTKKIWRPYLWDSMSLDREEAVSWNFTRSCWGRSLGGWRCRHGTRKRPVVATRADSPLPRPHPVGLLKLSPTGLQCQIL